MRLPTRHLPGICAWFLLACAPWSPADAGGPPAGGPPGQQGKADRRGGPPQAQERAQGSAGGMVERRGGPGDAHRHGTSARDYWTRDWELGAFLAAGFTVTALNGLLDFDSAPLHVGARPLPPGIAKNLARGKPLPPGIARQQLGAPLLQVLPRVHDHEWYAVGRDLVLVQAGTLLVVEILRAVLD
jgi:hypothetical protein